MDAKRKLGLLSNIIELIADEEDQERREKLQKLVNFKLDQIAAELAVEKAQTE